MFKSLVLLLLSLLLMAAACSKNDSKISSLKLQSSPVAGVPVRVATAKIYPAWNAATDPDPNCFVDLDKGAVYNVTTAPAHSAEIDFYWSTRPFYSDGLLCSPDESIANIGADMHYARDLKINTWIQQNRTLVACSNTLTIAGFDAVKTVPQLLLQWNRYRPYRPYEAFVASAENGSHIYVFETAQHKRGLLKFTGALFGARGYAEMQIKIEP